DSPDSGEQTIPVVSPSPRPPLLCTKARRRWNFSSGPVESRPVVGYNSWFSLSLPNWLSTFCFDHARFHADVPPPADSPRSAAAFGTDGPPTDHDSARRRGDYSSGTVLGPASADLPEDLSVGLRQTDGGASAGR